MSFLGELFPEEFRREFTERNLEVGTVLRMHVTDTEPPKIKFFIVIGFTNDRVGLGVLYINSEINPNVFRTQALKDLHLPLSADHRNLIDHDCFIDCSRVYEKETSVVYDAIQEQPECIRGRLSESELRKVQITISQAVTISPKIKRRFGYM